MRLEDLTIALRPRQPWEAVDLGCTLVRRDYGRILALWLISVVPVWIGLGILLRDEPAWFGLVTWWLKPLYDRLPLFHLSRAAFGARPTLKESLREWPRLWLRFLFSALVFRRLSLIRSFSLPVMMLEGQRGRAIGKRMKALATDGGGSGASLTWVFIKLEVAVWIGIFALVSTIGPSSGLPDWSELFQDPETFLQFTPAQYWFANILYLVAMTVVEPFYVGAGFGLYLNSRTKIEGWDIEMTFRRLAARLRPAITALLLACAFLTSLASAQESPKTEIKTDLQETSQTQETEKTLKDILAKPEFKEHSSTQKMWIPDNLWSDDSGSEKGETRWLGVLFYSLALASVSFLLYLAVRWLVQNSHLFAITRRAKTEAPAGPRVLMGMDIASENLPADIVAAARAAWALGHFREALSLLYRGSLSRLVEQQRLPIRASDTEDDCLLHVARTGDGPVTGFFHQLTFIWVRAAYAGIDVRAPEFEELCSTWPFPAQSNRKATGQSQRGLTTASAALLLLALPVMTGCSGHWEEVTIPQGYKGKARLDPFLAAQEFLQAYGHSTQRLPMLKDFPHEADGVIIVSGEAGMPEARARQLLEWANNGGHLVYALAGCAPYNDWGMFSSLSTFTTSGNEDRPDPILDAMGVTVEGLADLGKLKDELTGNTDKKKKSEKKTKKKIPSGEVVKHIEEPPDVPTSLNKIHFGSETYEVNFPSMLKLTLDRDLLQGEFAAGSAKKAAALSLHHGYGRITLLNHARPLRNRYLDENDHARWLLALIGEEPHTIHFIVSLQRSFWGLLWSRAWMPLIGLGLIVLLWLWMHLLRFGPLRQVVLHDTKHFADHIGALGQFFYRVRQPRILLTAAADAVRLRAVRKHPHLAHQSDEALVNLLADLCPLPKDRIRNAFVVPEKAPAHLLIQHLQDLQTLKTALG